MKGNLDYIDLRCKGVRKYSSLPTLIITDFTLDFPFNYDLVMCVESPSLYTCLHVLRVSAIQNTLHVILAIRGRKLRVEN